MERSNMGQSTGEENKRFGAEMKEIGRISIFSCCVLDDGMWTETHVLLR
jgi:hypothetical protein